MPNLSRWCHSFYWNRNCSPLDISLEDGDVVTISVDEIGILSNRVVRIDENIHNLTLGIG